MKASSSSPSRRSGALARARKRKRDAGAVMFIVAVTLGLLAVMGVYGLSATSADIRSAGHMREALQGQRASEAALMMTAETFNDKASELLVGQMTDPVGQARDCKTANSYTGNVITRDSEGCIRLDPSRMVTLANAVTPGAPWVVAPAPAQPGFTAKSFGDVTNKPFFSIEVANLVNTEVSAGYDKKIRFSQLTVSVFTQLKQSAGVAAETLVVGRGRITVGPITESGGTKATFP